jgi:hypothetical protein
VNRAQRDRVRCLAPGLKTPLSLVDQAAIICACAAVAYGSQ